jgi:hypothetical protein
MVEAIETDRVVDCPEKNGAKKVDSLSLERMVLCLPDIS